MKKLESSFKNMVIVLTVVAVVAGLLLGYVNKLTAEPIAQANAKALSDAIALVVPGFDNEPAANPDTIEVDGVTYKIYKATKGDKFIGAAVESSANGFGGALTVLVGFDADGKIIDYSLLSHKNPGDKPLTVSKDGGEIDAITASTITSRAFLNAVNAAYAAYAKQNGNEAAGLNGTTGATSHVEQN